MITLDEARANIGRGVVYKTTKPTTGRLVVDDFTSGARSEASFATTQEVREDGVITSVGTGLGAFVFVRYSGDQASKATRPEDLDFLG